MSDNTLTLGINVDNSGLEEGLKTTANLIDSTFKTIQLKAGETKAPMGELFRSLQSSSDSAINGLIRGTENWQQAVSNIATSMEVKFAQLASHRLLNWVESEFGMTQATLTGDAARTASNQSAASASSAANAGQMIKQIQSDSAATYAGVYANLSPVLGPLAAIPAGVSAGAVAAMEGLVSLDVGAWNVPQNMPAFLHAGEMVVPQNFASGLRDGGGLGGGGDSYTINVNAVDTQTGAQFLKNNASVIASALSAQMRNFNKSLQSWQN